MAIGKVAGPEVPKEAGALFVAATPIGNLGDVSTRLTAVLQRVSLVAAEDTRRARKLLDSLDSRAKLISVHAHNERSRIAKLLKGLQSGEDLVLLSDAGTPGISDPGMRLVSDARAAGVRVTPLPGPCAAIAALSIAGFSADRFRFEGFLPARSAARRARLGSLKDASETLVFYEAVHRLSSALDDLCKVLGGERRAFLARELTKLHESAYGDTLEELCSSVASGMIPQKGEFTLIVAGSGKAAVDQVRLDSVLEVLLEELSTRQAAKLGATITGASRRLAYQRALELTGRE